MLGGAPLSTDAPPFEARDHPKQPTDFWGTHTGPLPTNIWWQNLILDLGDQLVATLPYTAKALDDGLHLCMPNKVFDVKYIYQEFHDNWVVGAAEGLGARTLKKYDQMSATMQWESGFEVPLVRGMAYASFIYEGKTPSLNTIHAIGSINGGMEDSVTGTRFAIELDNGQKWIAYTSESVTFSRTGTGLSASAPLSGSVRLAIVTETTDEADLDASAGKIPVGGTIEAHSAGETATMTFNWETTGSGDLLMMALPHQMDIPLSGVRVTSTVVNGMKGDMTGVVGDSWSLTENLTPIEWDSPTDIDPARMDAIRNALNEDVNLHDVAPGDPYFGGKHMAKIARMALIADEMGEADLAQRFREKVRPMLESWLEATNSNPLLYDQTWGGVVSTAGINDPAADFGQGYYNDHHFHYGYHIYTAAVLTKSDPAWGAKYEDTVMHMVRDILEPSFADGHYTYSRQKDWYAGHAWANGIQVAFGDSHNQVHYRII